MDPVTGAALISAGSSLLGGIMGNKGPSLKSLNKQAEVQYNWQRKLNQTALQDKVRDAELAGIHPLYAISGQTNQGGISMPTGHEKSTGSRLSEMGQDISRAVASTGDRRQRQLMEKSMLLDIESKQISNDILKSQAVSARNSLTNQAGQPPAMQSVAGKKSAYESMGTPIGYQDGVKNLHQLSIDEDGDIMRVYNTNELGDNELAQTLHTLRYTLPDYIHSGVNGLKRSVKKGLQSYKNKYIKKGTFFNR